MTKVFQRIRQKLLFKNKLKKYLVYAIGEIILVVIGILIALGINNWNESRKTEDKIEQFLISLKSDLTEDLKEVDMVIEVQRFRSKMISEAIELSKKTNLTTLLLKDSTKYYQAGINSTFFPTVGSYSAASSAGIIDAITNVELKQNILKLFEQLYVRVAHNGIIVDERTGLIDWESRQYINDSEKRYTFDKKALLDADFISQLGYLNRFIGVYLDRCNNTKSGIEDVLISINKYLTNKRAEK